MELVRNIIEGILDLVYPKKLSCLYCRTPLLKFNKYELCSYCMSLLPFMGENICKRCGRPLEGGEADFLCSGCRNGEAHYNECCSVFEFSGIVKDMLHRLKYDGEVELAQPAGLFIAEKLRKTGWDIDFIIPVPLHQKRLSERGFNQSVLLAEVVGRECSIDVLEDVLIRQRETCSQVNLSRMERLDNVQNAFEIFSQKKLRGCTFLLLDDIMTTGATLNECSRVLKEGGAAKVYCITGATPPVTLTGVK